MKVEFEILISKLELVNMINLLEYYETKLALYRKIIEKQGYIDVYEKSNCYEIIRRLPKIIKSLEDEILQSQKFYNVQINNLNSLEDIKKVIQ